MQYFINKYLFTDPLPLLGRGNFYDAPIVLDEVSCTGSEEHLTDCTHSGYGDYSACFDVGALYCAGEVEYSDIQNNYTNALGGMHRIFCVLLSSCGLFPFRRYSALQ